MTAEILAAAGVLALITLLPGPDMAVVTKRAVSSGPAGGYRTAGGIVLGLLVWGLLTVAGLAAVLAASAVAYTVVKVVGCAYLLYLGVRTLWESRKSAAASSAGTAEADAAHGAADGPGAGLGGGAFEAWRTGLMSNLFNPKIAVFYTGLLPSLAPKELPVPAGLTLLVVLHVAITLAWLCGYVWMVTRARAVFEKPRVRRVMDRVTGVALLAFGARLATESS